MNKQEREALEFELNMLEQLINFHVENKHLTSMTKKEFEEYINAALEKYHYIKEQLKEDNND